MGFQKCNYDRCKLLYLLLYVDDILITISSKDETEKLKYRLNSKFEMKELGATKKIFGMDINRNRSHGELFLSQQGYIKKVVEKFRMHQSKPITTPLGKHDKLSIKHGPSVIEERDRMAEVP
ncbi:hypothetical protein CR513_10577, partial [Mucuna pruriens]